METWGKGIACLPSPVRGEREREREREREVRAQFSA
jgi:hypothetical protein